MVNSVKAKCKKVLYDIESKKKNNPVVLDRLKTSELIRDNPNLSVSRFGDGELSMITGKTDLGFQPYSESLSKMLSEVLTNGTSNANLLVCIPDVFSTVETMKADVASFWRGWSIHNKKLLIPFFNLKYNYGNSFVSRLYLSWKDESHEKEIVNNIKSAWNGKTVVVVEGKETRFGVGNDLLNNADSVVRILGPAKDAWSKYDRILSECKKFPNDGSVVFVLALGPAATVLSYDLSALGYRTLDLGHMDLQYEYMLCKADKKCIIKGKYNNEVTDGDIVDDCSDKDYLDSISAVLE